MSENNKSYRIRTGVGSEFNGDLKLNVNLLQDYETFEILSLKIETENLYKYHTSKYGCVVGRVLANGGVGVPNVKISVFIPVDAIDASDPVFSYLYPYSSTRDKNRDNIRYNLLTDTKINDCHQAIGTFPNKRLVLDDDNVIEIYDKYYKFTTTTNASGDYMLFGLPTGNNIIHSDLDLSDIGFLSQKPRDLFYKGYTARQFENASQFKKDTNLDNLTQVISQDSSVYVFPFWGDEKENEGQIKIVRNDIDVNYKFEPTCIFIGCIVSDEKSNAISKKCIPHERMGKMDRLTTGAGTIEMIRKTMSGDIESFSIQGNELIDGNGTWCYQVPMNLDYVATDEYGNLVPTDNFDKGLPTRTSVRFRVSLADYESDYENAHLVKVLVPNNPKETRSSKKSLNIDYDYEFGSATKDESFRDMFWNNVYTVKSYIPRFQKGNRQRNKNFTGFKAVNVNGANNPIPYNNMRINLTFLFVFQCLIFKSLIMIVKFLNKLIYIFDKFASLCCGATKVNGSSLAYVTLDGGMCPTLDGNFIAPGAKEPEEKSGSKIIQNTYNAAIGDDGLNLGDGDASGDSVDKAKNTTGTTRPYDTKSSDNKNGNYNNSSSGTGKSSTTYILDDSKSISSGDTETPETDVVKIYNTEEYFVKCVELQFAMEYEVIQFDFYNDWINGMLYIPRWFAEVRKNKDGGVYCGDSFKYYRKLVQQCALGYDSDAKVSTGFSATCSEKLGNDEKQRCHKSQGRKTINIFGPDRGIVKSVKNSRGQYAYYLRPCETVSNGHGGNYLTKINLFNTDIVLLGSVLDCNQFGIPKVNGYTSSSYKMPPPVAEIVSDTQEMEVSYGRTGPKDREECESIYTAALKKKIEQEVDNLLGKPYVIGEVETDLRNAITHPNNWKTYFNRAYDTLKDGYDAALAICIISLGVDVAACANAGAIKPTMNAIEDAKGRISEAQEILDREKNICLGNFSQNTPIVFKLFKFTKLNANAANYDGEPGTINYGEKVRSEISGIDWGYNPFTVGVEDNTKYISKQIAGHFLEIGCTFSLSNIKSCVNLQRICEIGSEMSQSHFYLNNSGENDLLSPTGIIGKREVSDVGIRSAFATLNSGKLMSYYDTVSSNERYRFNSYIPAAFMGDLAKVANTTSINKLIGGEYGLIETQSLSYKAFRFGEYSDIRQKFAKSSNGMYYMPQYENSFYFYFGLRDGNTAIDRLYTEYYAQCDKNGDTPSVIYRVESITDETYKYRITYTTINMSKIKSIVIKESDGTVITHRYYSGDNEPLLDYGKSEILLKKSGLYAITLIDTNDVVITEKVNIPAPNNSSNSSMTNFNGGNVILIDSNEAMK